ncbi:hypothetical protein K450DRAFT_252270 [Umbelopsis ramanniana AG]|uniref:Uncharacterized protein n=1 Tax=Umbelopsis ramanniana AG TaxID=1314678 RepID=A0AAD5E565_UMBRA|nr:uncharacterized protein K450DRAFT_252270 [Umbelopsis ramanniana AG]KAI8577403.1 hypothetical protein K450DRAFT_252270 [Umbelopsis ramanniana AG]
MLSHVRSSARSVTTTRQPLFNLGYPKNQNWPIVPNKASGKINPRVGWDHVILLQCAIANLPSNVDHRRSFGYSLSNFFLSKREIFRPRLLFLSFSLIISFTHLYTFHHSAIR